MNLNNYRNDIPLLSFLLCLAVAIAMGVPLHGAEPGKGSVSVWKKHMDEAEKAGEKGKLQEVEQYLVAALGEAENLPPKEFARLAESLRQLGNLYMLVDASKAEPLFRRAVETLEKNVRSNNPELAQALVNLMNACIQTRKLDDAEKIALRVRTIAEKNQGTYGKGVAAMDMNLARIYKELNRLDEAEQTFQKSLKYFETSKTFQTGPAETSPFINTPEMQFHREKPSYEGVLDCLQGLSEVHTLQGKIAEAEADHLRLVKTAEKEFSRNPLFVNEAILNFGYWNLNQKRYSEAESHIQRALAGYEKSLDGKVPGKQYILLALAQTAHGSGNHSEADIRLTSALKQERESGYKNPPTSDSLTVLSWASRVKRDPAFPSELLDATLAIKSSVLNPKDPRLAEYHEIAGVYHVNRDEWQKAEAPLQKALAIYEKALGPDHSQSAQTLLLLAGVREKANDHQGSENFLRRTIIAYGKGSPVDYAKLIAALNLLVVRCKETQRTDELPAFYTQIIEANEKLHGPEHLDVAQAIGPLADLYVSQEKFKEAQPYLERMLAIEEKQRGANNFVVLAPIIRLTAVYRKLGKDAELGGVLKKHMAIVEENFGANNKAVLASLDEYAQIMRRIGREAEATEAETRAKAIRSAQ